jgi:MFS transporter, FHS family, Na+ dependent glucose transporter 1
MGLAQGLVDVGSNSLITWVFHGRLGPYLSGLHFSFGVGAFAAPLLVAWVLQAQGRSAGVFWVLAGYLLFLALLFWLVPSPPHAEEAPLPANPAPPADKKLGWLFLACFFLYGGTESGFGAWIYHYALAFDPSATARAALLTSAFWGLLGLGRLAGIPVLARFTPRQFLGVLMPLAMAGFSVAVLWPGRVWSLWAGAVGAGLAMACVFPTLQVFAGQSLSRGSRVSSRLTSFFFIGSASGSMTLPWLMGQVFEPLGPRAALSIPALGAVGMAACFWLIRRRGL